MADRRLQIAMELLSLPTAPFAEGAVAQWLRSFARERGMRVKSDPFGNLSIRYRRGRARKTPLVIAAHMDHPGFVAERMRGRSTLLALWRGGVPPELFPGARVRFFSAGRWVRGTVTKSATKHVSGKPRPTTIAVESAVEPGSVGMWDFGEPRLRGKRLYARGHDDVASVAAIAAALDEAQAKRLAGDFTAFFTRAEEAGMIGAVAACRARVLPANGVIVALEASRALPNAPLGGGVVLRVGDRASIFSPSVTGMIRTAADALVKRGGRFKYMRRLMDGGTCESTAYVAYGYKAGGLCLPLGNYHNVDWDRMKLGPEYIDIDDFSSLVDLVLELAKVPTKHPVTPESKAFWERHFTRFGGPLREGAAGPGKGSRR